jgi:hypothetical protein
MPVELIYLAQFIEGGELALWKLLVCCVSLNLAHHFEE